MSDDELYKILEQDDTNTDTNEYILEMKDRIDSYRDITQNLATTYHEQLNQKNIHIRYIEAPKNVRIEAQDVANDCLHLSPIGHRKLAKEVYKELERHTSQ